MKEAYLEGDILSNTAALRQRTRVLPCPDLFIKLRLDFFAPDGQRAGDPQEVIDALASALECALGATGGAIPVQCVGVDRGTHPLA